jgi:hypothetical protein
MVDSFQPGLRQSACRTNSSSIVQADGLGLNPSDQEKHLALAKKLFVLYITFFKGWLRFGNGLDSNPDITTASFRTRIWMADIFQATGAGFEKYGNSS